MFDRQSGCQCPKKNYEWKAEVKGQASFGVGGSGIVQANYDILDRKPLLELSSYNIQVSLGWTGFVGLEAGIYLSGGGTARKRIQ